MNVEEFEIKQRSLASVKRARLKEKQDEKTDTKKEFKKVIREVKIPEQVTIQELSNRMAEQSANRERRWTCHYIHRCYKLFHKYGKQ